MKPLRIIVLVICAIMLSGCYQENEKFTINPDKSGKVSIDLIFQPMEFNITGEKEKSLDEQLKNEIANLLRNSSGVEAWSDVQYNWTDEGKMHFKGTAYFKDISTFEIKNIGLMSISVREENDRTVFELGEKKESGEKFVKPAQMTEEEIKNAILKQKAEFQQSKVLLTAILTDLRIEQTFILPGEVEQVVNLKKNAPNEVQVILEGPKIMKAIDELTKDDAYWRSTVIAGSEPFEDMDDRMSEKVFREKGPIKAVVKGPMKQLFDYNAEVTVAKQKYEEIMKQFGTTPVVPEPFQL